MSREKYVSSPATETVIPHWQPFGNTEGAIAYFAGKTASPKTEFHSLRIDLASPVLRIVVMGGAGGGETLSTRVSSFVRENRLLAGINAVPFNIISAKEGKPIKNEGIVISNGVQIAPANPHYDALYWYSDGSVSILSQSQLQSTANIENAAGGFHRILEAGKLSGRVINQEKRHPRTAAGISNDGKYLYFLVIDGRRMGSTGSTEAETAVLLRALGAHNGINLDGGGSSSMALRYPDGKVRVVNTPIHSGIPGRERAVAGCIGIYAID